MIVLTDVSLEGRCHLVLERGSLLTLPTSPASFLDSSSDLLSDRKTIGRSFDSFVPSFHCGGPQAQSSCMGLDSRLDHRLYW